MKKLMNKDIQKNREMQLLTWWDRDDTPYYSTQIVDKSTRRILLTETSYDIAKMLQSYNNAN